MTDFLLDLTGPLLLLGVIALLVGVLASAHHNEQAARVCRENLAKLETPRTAAEITAICK